MTSTDTASTVSAQEAAQNKKALFFLAAVMLVNALSYGTIIPLMYPYAQRFGLDAFGISMLFASFSLFQFLATPIIGRLSDIYGRRPLLLSSILGTGLSLMLFASATSVWMLFVARILDGITGGNMSVAQAVIADRIHGKERAKAFGMLGASFGFGFLVGPAIGGLLSEISLTAPFWFAGGLAILSTIFGYFFLEESLHPDHRRNHGDEPILNFSKLVTALKMPVMGLLILTIFVSSLAMNNFIIGFQSYTNDVLDLSPRNIGLIFALSGVVNIIMQGFGIKYLLMHFKNHERLVLVSEIGAAIFLASLAFTTGVTWFIILLIFFMFFNAPIMTVVSSMISERAHGKEQGEILGVTNSYMSLGQILGPIMAGLIATRNIHAVFFVGGVLMLVALFISYQASIRADLHAKIPTS
jgi:multidrug resistance protein